MPKLTMTKGLPASGKSTWAKQQNAKRVNKDDMRAMLDNSKWSKENERLIVEVRDFIVLRALMRGFDVIVDDTNLAPKHEAALRSLASRCNANFEVKDFTDVPLAVCLARDAARPYPVGRKVIEDMHMQFVGSNE